MNQYAIVRFLDGSKATWDEIERRYLRRARAIKEQSTLRCSELPSLKTFREYMKLKRCPRLIGKFAAADADDYLAWLVERFASPHTVSHKVAVVRGVFKYAVEMHESIENPFERIKVPDTMSAGRYLDDGQLSRFLALLPQRVRWAYEFSLYTGIRRCEILAMAPAWVHGDQLTVPAEVAKSRSARTIMLNPRALEILDQISAFRRARGESVVAGYLGYKENIINWYGTAAWKRLGIGRIRFHDMRHNWATRFYEVTRDLKALMDQGGWKHVSSVMIYQHMTPTRQAGNLHIRYRLRY